MRNATFEPSLSRQSKKYSADCCLPSGAQQIQPMKTSGYIMIEKQYHHT